MDNVNILINNQCLNLPLILISTKQADNGEYILKQTTLRRYAKSSALIGGKFAVLRDQHVALPGLQQEPNAKRIHGLPQPMEGDVPERPNERANPQNAS